MYSFPIGAIVESFRTDFDSAIEKAAQIGVEGLQLYTVKGEFSTENLSREKRKEILKKVKDKGLRFSALCGDFGVSFMHKEKNPEMIEKSKRVLELACELETDIVTTHIGIVPEDETVERYSVMQDACFKLAEYADSLNAHFAVETGPEKSAVLKKFLDSLNSKGVAVNFDPANLRMSLDEDAVDAVYNLKDYIVHTHAKDGIIYELINNSYDYRLEEPPAGYFDKTYYKEVPLGVGQVNFPTYLKALESIGYKGFLTIERECGDNPEKDIERAVEFLRDVIKYY